MLLAACAGSGIDGLETTRIEIGDQQIMVALADTAELRQQGLRNVESLPDAVDGMLFVFGEARPATFGMRDTLIPLDIWWFDGDGFLVGSTEMTPCPEEPCTAYASPVPVAWALETPAGEFHFATGAALSTGDIP